jgi:hypothetical protein
MATKQKLTTQRAAAMQQKDLILPMLLLLLVIVVLLLVTPSICSCRWLGSSPSNSGIGATPLPVATSTTTTTTPPVTPTSTAALDPQSGPVGTIVTIHGSGFSADNTIEMNDLVSGSMKDAASPDGKTLTFNIPANLGPNCKPTEACPQFLMLVMPNIYKISVVTNSATQDIGTFTVTGR